LQRFKIKIGSVFSSIFGSIFGFIFTLLMHAIDLWRKKMEIIQNSLKDPFFTDEFVAGRGLGHISYFGLEMSQNQNAVIVWDTFLKQIDTPLARIIELGTGSGGLSVLFSIYCTINNIDFVTYDLPNDSFTLTHQNLFDSLGIDYRVKDLSLPDTIEEVGQLTQQDGPTLLLCDARKEEDWNDFASYLKTGDYIAAHDYSPTEEYFWEKMAMKIWSFIFIDDARITDSCEKYNLKPCCPEMFLSAAWVCKQKH